MFEGFKNGFYPAHVGRHLAGTQALVQQGRGKMHRSQLLGSWNQKLTSWGW